MRLSSSIEQKHVWAEKNKNEIKTIRCEKCGKSITISKPFILARIKGLITDSLGCEAKCLASLVFKIDVLKKTNVFSAVRKSFKNYSKIYE